MVLVWGYLARGNDGHTLVMVAINSLTMLFLYGPLGGSSWASVGFRFPGRRWSFPSASMSRCPSRRGTSREK